LPATRRFPSKRPVSAGLRVSGEEKNCEKCGSCARIFPLKVRKIAIAVIHFIIAKDDFFRKIAAPV
jgi:hypothetical protein